MKSPKQQIYDKLFETCETIHERVFTKLPPLGTEYPFIVFGATYKQDSMTNKSFITGNVQQHIHIFSLAENKIDASGLEFEITKICQLLKNTDTFYLRLDGVNSDELIEVSDGEDLIHIDLEIDYRFS